MNPHDKEQIARIICYGVGLAIAYYLLVWLFRYVVGFLAIMGLGYLCLQYLKNNHRNW